MGSISRLFGYAGGGGHWCDTMAENDKPFSIPYKYGEDLFFWFDMSSLGYPFGLRNVHICDLNGNRIIPNLLSTLGQSYYKGADGWFAMRIPGNVGVCTAKQFPDPDYCLINLLNSAPTFMDMANRGYATSATLYFGANSYNILNDVLPAGWSYVHQHVKFYRQYINVPCTYTDNAARIVTTFNLGSGPVTVTEYLSKSPIKGYTADTGIVVPVTAYNLAKFIYMMSSGIQYTFATVGDWGNPTPVPLFGNKTQHFITTYGATFPYFVPISDALLGEEIKVRYLNTGPGAAQYLNHFWTVQEYNIVNHTVSRLFDCFKIEIELAVDDVTTGPSVFSEPFHCIKSHEQTVRIRSDYKGKKDCFNQQYSNFTGNYQFGNMPSWNNALRIPAILRKLPSKIALTKNANDFTFKSEATETFELQGTVLFPPYFAEMVENIFAGSDLYIDDVKYQFRGEKIFEPVSINGITAYKLKTQLERSTCDVVFNC